MLPLVNVRIENFPVGRLLAAAREVYGAAGVGDRTLHQLGPVLVAGVATAPTTREAPL